MGVGAYLYGCFCGYVTFNGLPFAAVEDQGVEKASVLLVGPVLTAFGQDVLLARLLGRAAWRGGGGRRHVAVGAFGSVCGGRGGAGRAVCRCVCMCVERVDEYIHMEWTYISRRGATTNRQDVTTDCVRRFAYCARIGWGIYALSLGVAMRRAGFRALGRLGRRVKYYLNYI